MSAVRLIRCKTAHDIIVIKRRDEFDTIADSLQQVKTCDHSHLIVCGDVWFSKPNKKLVNDIEKEKEAQTCP